MIYCEKKSFVFQDLFTMTSKTFSLTPGSSSLRRKVVVKQIITYNPYDKHYNRIMWRTQEEVCEEETKSSYSLSKDMNKLHETKVH